MEPGSPLSYNPPPTPGTTGSGPRQRERVPGMEAEAYPYQRPAEEAIRHRHDKGETVRAIARSHYVSHSALSRWRLKG